MPYAYVHDPRLQVSDESIMNHECVLLFGFGWGRGHVTCHGWLMTYDLSLSLMTLWLMTYNLSLPYLSDLRSPRHEPILIPPAVLRRGDAAHIWHSLNTRGPSGYLVFCFGWVSDSLIASNVVISLSNEKLLTLWVMRFSGLDFSHSL